MYISHKQTRTQIDAHTKWLDFCRDLIKAGCVRNKCRLSQLQLVVVIGPVQNVSLHLTHWYQCGASALQVSQF